MILEYIQILVALGALLLEYENFSHAKELFEAEDRVEIHKEILRQYPLMVLPLLTLCGFGYLILSVVWVFSPDLVIRIAGIALVGLSLLGTVLKKFSLEKLWHHPVAFRINSAISMACLGAVVIVKGIAF